MFDALIYTSFPCSISVLTAFSGTPCRRCPPYIDIAHQYSALATSFVLISTRTDKQESVVMGSCDASGCAFTMPAISARGCARSFRSSFCTVTNGFNRRRSARTKATIPARKITRPAAPTVPRTDVSALNASSREAKLRAPTSALQRPQPGRRGWSLPRIHLDQHEGGRMGRGCNLRKAKTFHKRSSPRGLAGPRPNHRRIHQ